MSRDPRIDAYIARSADFAKPILEHLRATVHAACPEVEETIKWSMPFFAYKGRPLANMAAFKAHATFGFWRGSEVVGKTEGSATAMGQFGRLASIDDLPPPDELAGMIRNAVSVTEAPRERRQPSAPRTEIPLPEDFAAALADNADASATYDGFPPSGRYDYLEWITGAKRPETRAKRIAQSIEWLAEGKRRNWKYEASQP